MGNTNGNSAGATKAKPQQEYGKRISDSYMKHVSEKNATKPLRRPLSIIRNSNKSNPRPVSEKYLAHVSSKSFKSKSSKAYPDAAKPPLPLSNEYPKSAPNAPKYIFPPSHSKDIACKHVTYTRLDEDEKNISTRAKQLLKEKNKTQKSNADYKRNDQTAKQKQRSGKVRKRKGGWGFRRKKNNVKKSVRLSQPEPTQLANAEKGTLLHARIDEKGDFEVKTTNPFLDIQNELVKVETLQPDTDSNHPFNNVVEMKPDNSINEPSIEVDKIAAIPGKEPEVKRKRAFFGFKAAKKQQNPLSKLPQPPPKLRPSSNKTLASISHEDFPTQQFRGPVQLENKDMKRRYPLGQRNKNKAKPLSSQDVDGRWITFDDNTTTGGTTASQKPIYLRYDSDSDSGHEATGAKTIQPTNSVINKGVHNAASAIKKEDPLKSRYKVVHKLGEGAFAKVFKVCDQETGEFRAMKIARLTDIHTHEIAMHSITNHHENIVQFVEAFKYKRELYMVVELMELGALYEIVGNKFYKWREPLIAYVINQVMHGLRFMHSRSRVHRDIKSENILLGKNAEVKIGDLGCTISLTQQKPKRKSLIGTPWYMAPELITKNMYDAKVDVWSTAITAIEIAEGDPPRAKMKPMKVMAAIVDEPAPQLKKKLKWSKAFNNYLERSLQKYPMDRASSKELLDHPFLTKKACNKKAFAKFILDSRKKREGIVGY